MKHNGRLEGRPMFTRSTHMQRQTISDSTAKTPAGSRGRGRGFATVLLVVGLGTGLLAGCNQGPSGRQGGNVDPYEQVKGTSRDRAVNDVTLLEFTDQVTQSLAERIPTVADIRNAPTKPVIAVGAITNRTNTPSSDFAAVRSQIFTDMVNSTVAQQADILDTLEVMDEQAARYAQPGRENRMDERGVTVPTSARYDPKITYILNGEFSEISRGENGRSSTYIFNWRLVNLGTSKTVFADRVTAKQTRP
jgi:hypothetical protein